jgi:histidinol-phosphatase (PHP family)
MIDYHVHTSLCNHASGSMAQYIQKAVEIGLQEICFLDHLTLHDKGRHLSMSPEELPFYFQAARHLAEQYKPRIRVKVGLEVDFDAENARRIADIIAPYAFDVIGGSVHFIESIDLVSSRETQARDRMGMEEICDRYLDNLDAMLDTGIADFICHLDVIKKFGRRPPAIYDDKFDAILAKISYKNIAVELNTSGYDHLAKEPYPSALLLKKCRDKNISVTLGSDAHSPEAVGRYYDRAMALFEATGYRQVCAFTRRHRYEISLNP